MPSQPASDNPAAGPSWHHKYNLARLLQFTSSAAATGLFSCREQGTHTQDLKPVQLEIHEGGQALCARAPGEISQMRPRASRAARLSCRIWLKGWQPPGRRCPLVPRHTPPHGCTPSPAAVTTPWTPVGLARCTAAAASSDTAGAGNGLPDDPALGVSDS